MFLKRKQFQYTDLIKHIEDVEIYAFVEQEIELYLSANAGKGLTNSILTNIALFNLSSLADEDSKNQMIKLLSDNNVQSINRRLLQLIHTLYIRYGLDAIDDIGNHVLSTMGAVYKLPDSVIIELDTQFIYFWLVPLIRVAYYRLLTTTPDNDAS